MKLFRDEDKIHAEKMKEQCKIPSYSQWMCLDINTSVWDFILLNYKFVEGW
jgi:hypothetical protein